MRGFGDSRSTEPLGGHFELNGPVGETDVPFAEMGGTDNSSLQGGRVAQLDGDAPAGAASMSFEVLNAGGGAPSQFGVVTAWLRTALLPAWRAINVFIDMFDAVAPWNATRSICYMVVFISVWLSLKPGPITWALGLLYLLAASMRVGIVEPLWTAAVTLAAYCSFGAAPESAQPVLWYALGVLGVGSEFCWWPSSQFLIRGRFHSWFMHFTADYTVAAVFWFFPMITRIDFRKWPLFKQLWNPPAHPYGPSHHSTGGGGLSVGVQLAILLLVPLIAMFVVVLVIAWQRYRKLCITIASLYLSLVALLAFLAHHKMTREQCCLIVQLAMAGYLLILARHQLMEVFDDSHTWRGLAAALSGMFVLQLVATAGVAPSEANHIQAAGILLFLILSQQWLSAQCSAVRLGLPSALARAAWAPRRSGLLFSADEVHEPRLALAR